MKNGDKSSRDNSVDIDSIVFPKEWSKINSRHIPPHPKDIWEFLNSVQVSEEEVKRGRPVRKVFVL